jgi:dTDP-4-amino-4,6-dideoxygalactose transaminase
MIPVSNPKAEYEHHRAAIQQAVMDVLESGWYIHGQQVKGFEAEFAAWCGVPACAGVANGTDAISLALQAVGVGPGDEVITVSHTAVATVAAIELIGAVPVFADIDPATRGLDPAALPGLRSPKTRAIVPVHINGQPVELDAILAFAKQHGLKVVEDCAQAHGAQIGDRRVGSMGDAGAFSFYPTKNLGALGDGGAVVSSDPAVIERVRLLREYGWAERYISHIAGRNSRLDELQAAILRVKLPHLDAANARRRAIASRYHARLAGTGLTLPTAAPGTEHVFHLYVVEHPERDALAAFLRERGVATALHYPQAVHQQPAYAGRLRGGDALPRTEALYRRLLSLPMFPELTDAEVDQVCDAVLDWAKSAAPAS